MENIVKEVYRAWKQLHPASTPHPGEEVFAAFLEGRLSAEASAKIKEHIVSCEACSLCLAAEFSSRLAASEELPLGLAEKARSQLSRHLGQYSLVVSLRARDDCLQLLNSTGDVLVGQEFVPAAVFRSRQIQDFREGLTVLKDFKDLRAELRIVKKEDGYFAVSMSIRRKDTQEPSDGLRVTLFSDDRELESYVPVQGKVVFERVALGKHTIEISSIKERIATVSLDIKP